MLRPKIRRWVLLVTAVFVAGCGSHSMETQNPPLSDVRYDRLQGHVEQASVKVYLLERPADMAAVLASPETFSPPTDLPPKSKDGEDVTERAMEMRYGPTGNTLTFRTVFLSLGGSEFTVTTSPKAPGLRSLQCEGSLVYKGGPRHPFSCGHGEWSYRSPGVWRMMVDSQTSTSVIERQVDPQGRETVFDQKTDGKKAPSGEKSKDFSLHAVSQTFDDGGRVTVARETKNGQLGYRYTTYSQFDHHGNPQRAVVMSSTSADPHDRTSVTKIELRLYSYSYYDEIR
jgi:hypothetical protein